jgi:hypothetical protein
MGAMVAMLTSTPALAGGFSSVFTITQVFPREMGTDFSVSPAVTSAVGCSRTDVVRIMLTTQNYEMLNSTMLTAFAMSGQVTVWVDHCDIDGVPVFVAATLNR